MYFLYFLGLCQFKQNEIKKAIRRARDLGNKCIFNLKNSICGKRNFHINIHTVSFLVNS